MKTTIIIILFGIFVPVISQAQYAFCYAINREAKIAYVSYVVNKNNFQNCSTNTGYGTQVKEANSCIWDEFATALKIEVGDKYRSYTSYMTPDNNRDWYDSESACNEQIRKTQAEYREDGYTVYRITIAKP